jgi:hypothetical protein
MLEADQRGPRFTISLKRSTKFSAIHKPPPITPSIGNNFRSMVAVRE